MKKLAFIAAFGMIGFSSLAQEAPLKASAQSIEKVIESKSTGIYEFQMPSELKAEDIKKNAEYYTQYFTVTYDNATKKAVIKMIENTEKSRLVIVRFMIANNVKEIKMGETTYSVEKFYADFIK